MRIMNDLQGQTAIAFDAEMPQNPNPVPPGTLLVDKLGYPVPEFFNTWQNNGQTFGANTGVMTCGNFTLVFGDVVYSTGLGFDAGSGVGLIRQQTACAVFTYIQSVIDIGNAQPIIYFDTYVAGMPATDGYGDESNYYTALPNYIAPFASLGNIPPSPPKSGFLCQYITSQTNPFPADYPHGRIQVNFGYTNIHDDYATTSGVNPDLFTIILHHATHLLGIESYLNELGMNGVNGQFGPFSVFDIHLIQDVVSPSGFFTVPEFFSTYLQPSYLIQNDLAYRSNNNNILAVYSPAVFDNMRSRRHLDPVRDNVNYVIQPNYIGGDIRQYTSGEEEILCDLGYKLKNSSTSPCDSWRPAGVDDFITVSQLYSSVNQSTLTVIPVLQNDIYPFHNTNTLDVDYNSVVVPFFGTGQPSSGAASYDPATKTIEFYSNTDFCGHAFIYYRPVDKSDPNNPIYGSYAMVTVYVNCEKSYDNPCNIIYNGGFEAGMGVWDTDYQCVANEMIQIGYNNISPLSEIYNWQKINKPDLFIRGSYCTNGIPNNSMGLDTHNGSPNDRYVSLTMSDPIVVSVGGQSYPIDTRNGIFTQLNKPLDPNKKYRLEFMVNAQTYTSNGNQVFPYSIEAFLTKNPPNQYPTFNFEDFATDMNILPLQLLAIDNDWHCIVVDDIEPNQSNLNYLVIRTNQINPAGQYMYAVVSLDDVHLSEKNLITLNTSFSIPSNNFLPGSAVNISFEVCNTTDIDMPANTITLNTTLPNWLTPSGLISIPIPTVLSYNSCQTFTINATVNNNPLNLSEGICTILNDGCTLASCASTPVCTYLSTDITVKKSVDNPTPTLGDIITFNIIAKNEGNITAHDVQIEDQLSDCFLPFGTFPDNYDPVTHLFTFAEIAPSQTVATQIQAMYIGDACNNNAICSNTASLFDSYEVDINSANDIITIYVNGIMPTNNVILGNTIFTSPITYSNQNITVNGILTVQSNVTFQGCSVKMMPGAMIFVDGAVGANFNIIGGTHIFACEEMWRGIEVSAGGIVNVKNSAIEDAEIAIHAQKAKPSWGLWTRIVIARSIFNNNYIGVGVLETSSEHVNQVQLEVRESTFETTTTLKPYNTFPAFWQPLTHLPTNAMPYTWGYAGIILRDMYYGANFNTAVFQSLSNGIISDRTNLTMQHSRFYHISDTWETLYKLNDMFQNNINGTAVYSTGGHGFFNTSQAGYGSLTIKDFYRCKYGVYGDRVGLRIYDNRMDNIQYGIYSNFPYQNVNISFNQMNCYQTGIWMIETAKSPQIDIRYNNISVENTGNATLTGILNWNYPAPQNALNTFIEHNTVHIENGLLGGIAAAGTEQITIKKNKVSFGNAFGSTWGRGILLYGKGGKITCNTVSGPSYNELYSEGIHVESSENSLVSCNTTNNCGIGFMYKGLSDNSIFRGNDIGRHYFGLFLSGSAVIGDQDRRGNIWTGGAYTSSPALNVNFSNISGSWFHVVPFNVNAKMPTSNGAISYFPMGGPDMFNNNISVSSDYASCHTQDNTGECDGDIIAEIVNPISPSEMKVANNDYITEEYPETALYEGKRNLYEKVKADMDLTDDAAMEDFYDATENTLIADFYDLEMAQKAAKENYPNIAAAQESVQNLLHSLAQMDSIIRSDSIATDTTGFAAQRTTILAQLQSLEQNYETLATTAIQTQVLNAETARQQASTLQVNEIYEENEKLIQGIYFNTIGKEIFTFTLPQKNTIEAIAWQCPLAGGSAVYKARSLYIMFHAPVRFNDDSLCSEVNMDWRKSAIVVTPAKTVFTLYPNPATNEVILSLSEMPFTDRTVNIYNSFGQLIYQSNWQQENLLHKIDTHTFGNGIYFINVIEQGNIIHQGKAIISH